MIVYGRLAGKIGFAEPQLEPFIGAWLYIMLSHEFGLFIAGDADVAAFGHVRRIGPVS
jgi:hypothetical protein